MSEVTLSKGERLIRARIQHYNETKYWKYRNEVISCVGGRVGILKCQLKLLYIKRCDAFNNASLGTHLGFGASFADIPNFPHGLYGIVISHNAVIGKNCTIYHQVTIGEGHDGAPRIGNDVWIGPGAKVFGNIRIGNNVRIGANCVVFADISDNTTIKCSNSIVCTDDPEVK